MLLGVRDAEIAGERVEAAAAGSLAGAVLGYRGFRETAPEPRERWETPSGEVILVVGFGDPFIADDRRFTSFVAGLHERPIHTVYRGAQFGIQVRLDPLAAAAILGIPMHELTNRIVEWDAPPIAGESWPERFAALDSFFGAPIDSSPIVRQAWSTLKQSGGTTRVEELVAAAGCSHRHLVELFRRDIGLPPKRAARVLRFQSAAWRVRGGGAPAAVAARHGFTDQPHLTREFRRLAGVTPGQISPRP